MKADLYNKFVEKQEQQEIEEQKNLINNKQEIVMIDVNLLDEFNNHIFSAISQNKFEELKESVSRSGVLSPIIVRKKQNRYEIISGHNRARCCKELNITEIPAIIKDYDDDMAELIMIETNLAQRENILPCEKGLAYKKRLEILKKIRKENDTKTSDDNDLLGTTPMEQEEYSVEKLANESEDSRATIQRLIRLTELNNDLKSKVNNDVIGIRAGVELSYIKPEEQVIVNDIIDENNLKLTTAQAQKLRAVYGTITKDNVLEIIKGKPKKKENKFTGRLVKNILKKYKDKFANDKEFSELIDFLLENHYKNLSDERRTK
ncbi:MAG: ParB/RepB/Spo0J family partition protein [Bacilli bacterium]